jgi:hypothetical protein
MFQEKLSTSDGSTSGLIGHNDLAEQYLQKEHEELQMKIYLDYCYFIEKLWLDWKEYCMRIFSASTK